MSRKVASKDEITREIIKCRGDTEEEEEEEEE